MSNKVQAELIHLIGEYVALRFIIPEVTEGVEVEGDQLYAIFAVDKSGSMQGSPMNDAKGAAESLTTKFRKLDIPVSVIPFDNGAKDYSSENVGYDKIITKIQHLYASGGTIFCNVMNLINTKINQQNLKNIFAVWLTDGQDNHGLNTLIPIMDAYQAEYEKKGISISIHCIGFSSGHDATLLSKLSTSGTRQGSFQYVPEGGRIPVAVNNVFNLAFESTTWARFLAKEGVTYKVNIEKDETTKELKALVYVSENDIEDCKIELHKGAIVCEYDMDLARAESKNLEDLVFLVTAFISSKVVQALETGIDGTAARLRDLASLIFETDRRIDYLIEQSHKLRPYKQKQIQPYFNSTKELITHFNNIIGTLSKREITNEDFAKLNGLANSLFLKRKLEQKIAKESSGGLHALENSEIEVDLISQSYDISQITSEHRDAAPNAGICGISKKN